MDASPSDAIDLPAAAAVDWRIGTMSFTDPAWSGPFYPDALKPGQWLEYYSRHYNAVELDTTFYAIPPPDRVRRWRDTTPADFRFCLKTPRSITHDRPLSAGAGEMLQFLDVCRVFEDKLGVVLIQFPPAFTADNFAAVEQFIEALPRDMSYAIELRHRSWGTLNLLQMLHDRGVAFVSAEYASRPSRVFATAEFLYVRWIGVHDRYATHDREQADVTEALAWWRQAIAAALPKVKAVWGFFNNDYAGYSPATANRFKRLIGLPAKEPTQDKTPGLFDA